jgi:formylglycine-generating enzyme required for sulfatase activity
MRRAQEAWSKYLGRRVEETVEIAGGATMTFVLVPPGRFRMGSPDEEEGRDEDETPHVVVLTEPFDLGKYAVTQQQYEALAGRNPSDFKGPNRPVDQVNWDEADAFGRALAGRRSDGHVYRLPTEAEREYACRGGRPPSMPFGVGDGRSLSSGEANFDGRFPYGGAGPGPSLQGTCKVGSYAANAAGICDLHGNVMEWCADRYGPYPDEGVTNPAGPADGSLRVLRGGAWYGHGSDCRAAYRVRLAPGFRGDYTGFRLARTIPPVASR